MPLLNLIPKDQECPYRSKCGLYFQCYKTEEDEEDYYCPTYIAFLNQGVSRDRVDKVNIFLEEDKSGSMSQDNLEGMKEFINKNKEKKDD